MYSHLYLKNLCSVILIYVLPIEMVTVKDVLCIIMTRHVFKYNKYDLYFRCSEQH